MSDYILFGPMFNRSHKISSSLSPTFLRHSLQRNADSAFLLLLLLLLEFILESQVKNFIKKIIILDR